MKKYFSVILFVVLLCIVFSESGFAQRVLIGPRLTGNLNIFNQKGLTGSFNGVGIGIGGTVDASFSRHIGLMVNLIVFDMRNFSNSQTANNVTTDQSLSLSYVTLDPMFKAEFSGFYMVGGPSLGIKINSSGERTDVQAGQAPVTNPMNLDTKSMRFDIALGTGYTFVLSEGMFMGTDFMAHIPLTDTYNFPGIPNSVFSLKLGVTLKFEL
jgi:hypothetical protein